MRNYQTRLARLRELKPPPPPPGPLWTYTELAAHLETLLNVAKRYPKYKPNRYTLEHLAGLVVSCFEEARKSRMGLPHYSTTESIPLTPEERLTLLVENMDPQQLATLYGFFEGQGLEVAWIQRHHEQVMPDGSTKPVEKSEIVWVKDREPYRERGILHSGGHFEGKEGQKIISVGNHYVLKTIPDLGDEDEIRRAAEVTERLGRLMAISPVEDVGAADTPIDEPQFEDISPVEGLGATETPPIPEPLPIPDPPPIPKPSPEPVGIPPERRPRPLTIRGGGLRPAGSATGPWR